MIRPVLSLLALAFASPAFAEDPPVKKQTEPPKTAEPEKSEPADVVKTAERIMSNAREVGKRLSANDPGQATRALQGEVIKDIDALIRKAQDPPPKQNGSGMNNAGGGMNNSGGGMNNSGDSLSRKERRERARQNFSGGGSSPTTSNGSRSKPIEPKSPGSGPGQPNPLVGKPVSPRAPDLYKDVWGHLPEKVRREMDLYFREEFMQRYSELLKQYYSSLAERGSRNGY